MQTKCKNADKYQAQYPPKCSVGGRVCDVCKTKWTAKNRATARKSVGVK